MESLLERDILAIGDLCVFFGIFYRKCGILRETLRVFGDRCCQKEKTWAAWRGIFGGVLQMLGMTVMPYICICSVVARGSSRKHHEIFSGFVLYIDILSCR
jgi:hypothetical protein